MSFLDNLATMQATVYAELGLPATWTPPNAAPPAGPNITVLLATPPASDDSGGLWKERPERTPGRMVRVRTSDLVAIDAMTLDPATKSPAPAWRGVQVNFDGVQRRIIDKPEPADDLYRVEWVLFLD